MPETDIGSEQFTDEDRSYAGSRFRDVVDALFANPYQQVWGRAGEPPLPVQEMTIKSVFGTPFTIDVTDEGITSGTSFRVRRTFQNWRGIGTLVFDNAVVSYNGDAVIHFTHPTWRQHRNDPATATRVNGVKVR